MDPKNLNSYVGVVNQPPPKWSSVKKWLLHINYAPGYAPEPEEKPVCRQFSRCEGCPYTALRVVWETVWRTDPPLRYIPYIFSVYIRYIWGLGEEADGIDPFRNGRDLAAYPSQNRKGIFGVAYGGN